MSKSRFSKKNIKKIWDDKKDLIIGVGVAVTGVGGLILGAHNIIKSEREHKKEGEEIISLLKESESNFDSGRDCLMTFTVEETGEELGSVPVCESYVNVMLDSYNDFVNGDQGD